MKFPLTLFIFALVWINAIHASVVPEPERISNFDARLALAKILSEKKSWVADAQQHLEILVSQQPHNPAPRLLVVRVLIQQQRYQEASEEAQKLLEAHPDDGAIIAQVASLELDLGHFSLSRDLFEKALSLPIDDSQALLLSYAGAMQRWGEYPCAQAIYRDYLSQNPDAMDVELRLAEAMMGEQRFAEAEQIYYTMLNHSVNREALLGLAQVKFIQREYCEVLELLAELDSPEADVLKAQALEKKGCREQALDIYLTLATNEEYPFEAMTYFINGHRLARNLGLDCLAQQLLDQAEALVPDAIPVRYYLNTEPLLTSPGELLEWGALLVDDGCVPKAIELYQEALEIDADFDPARLGLADFFATELLYGQAIRIYEELLCEFPESPGFELQYARLVSWDKQYIRALCLYNEYIEQYPCNPIPRIERARVALWAQKGSLAKHYYEQLLAPPDDSSWALCRIQRSVELEMNTQWALWNNRNLSALRYFNEWIDERPGSEDALFGYAELCCSLGMIEEAQCIFEKIHVMDPQHSIVNRALDRRVILDRPATVALYDYWHEVGYGELVGIWRHKPRIGCEYPLNPQTTLRCFYDYFVDHTLINHHTFKAQGLTVEYQQAINPCLAAACTLTGKFGGNYHIHGKWTGSAHLDARATDILQMSVGCERKDEYYNYFGVLRGVQSTSVWANSALNPCRRLFLESGYQYYRYNDHNSLNVVRAASTYQLTEYPCILRFILQGEYRNTAQLDQFIYLGDTLVDIIHPYWCPQRYWAGRGGIEWYHDLTRFSFCGGQKKYYSARLTAGDDTQNNPGMSFNLEYHCDWANCWSLQVAGAVFRSRQWDAEGVWSSLSYRF